MSTQAVVNTLWTGGWDSSFRVLWLVHVNGSLVQPHYIVDPTRLSIRQELNALGRIREALSKVDEESSRRILPTQVVIKDEIPSDAETSALYARLRRRFELSSQYEWINRYAKHYRIPDLELGFQRNDDAPHFEALRAGAVRSEARDGSPTWRLPKDNRNEDLSLFRGFSFPNLWLTKNEMREQATIHGFLEPLEMSWFCHYPVRSAPCGACSVCRHVMDAGMSERFTLLGRARNRIWPLYHPARLLLTEPDRFFQRWIDIATWKSNRP